MLFEVLLMELCTIKHSFFKQKLSSHKKVFFQISKFFCPKANFIFRSQMFVNLTKRSVCPEKFVNYSKSIFVFRVDHQVYRINRNFSLSVKRIQKNVFISFKVFGLNRNLLLLVGKVREQIKRFEFWNDIKVLLLI
jgi:hypothetical protein